MALANQTLRFLARAFFLYEILNVTFSPKNLCAYLRKMYIKTNPPPSNGKKSQMVLFTSHGINGLSSLYKY